ncbi:DNA-binding response regulator [Microgenomates group bacterium RIFCSPLOWO2_01_FULL_46_13]|nr:MAG: DNA-binding response regulator [Microgenomates group bacterium RIFCSPHIGHO2_01_FULL_45_11]OGV94962.1 MAG: DNA-binding response regulator [Microgenomates group bacterium RIFCSPLOWO2_01_FULL_46_13]
MRILVVEDEHKIANSLKKGLVQESFAVDVAYEGESGYDLASSEAYDAIILDLMLPKLDGLTICTKLRHAKNHTPILMLTAKGQLDDKVTGLNAGADDYLVKPFAFQELLARVKALTRRSPSGGNTKLNIEDLELDSISYEIKRLGKSITLSRKEFSILEYLMRNPKKILSKDQIIAHVWDYNADILENTVEVFISSLRRKVDKSFPKLKPLIQTIRGFGYKIS